MNSCLFGHWGDLSHQRSGETHTSAKLRGTEYLPEREAPTQPIPKPLRIAACIPMPFPPVVMMADDRPPGIFGIGDPLALHYIYKNNNNNETMQNNNKWVYEDSGLSLQPYDVPVDWSISIFPDNTPEVPLTELHNVPSEDEMLNDIWRIVDSDICNALANIRI